MPTGLLLNSRSVPLYLVLAVGYFASGVILSAFSSQSQVVPIWIPAGIALAGCYLYWWRFFPAVFIASSLFNFYADPNASLSGLFGDTGAPIFLIGFGATLQAVVGSALLRFWLGNPLQLQSDRKSIAFVIIVGIGVNLISANIGVFALSQFSNSYSLDNHWSNVMNWWFGDSLGVLLALPFILALRQLPHRRDPEFAPRILTLLTTLFLALLITITTNSFSKSSNKNAMALAQREIRVVENSLYRQLNNTLAQMQTLAVYIQSTPNLTREQFSNYVATLMSSQPTIQAMSWNPLLQQSESIALAENLTAIYQRPMVVKGTPLTADDPLVVVKFIHPEKGNENAIGFNVYSNSKRKSVLADKRLQYQPMATPIIQLVQSKKAEPGFLLFAPVFGIPQADDPNSAGKGKTLLGYATGVFLVDTMLHHALEKEQASIFNYELYEPGETKPFASNTGSDELILASEKTTNSLQFDLAGQTWIVNLLPTKEFLSHYQSDMAKLLYILQVIVVIFVILLLLLMNNRRNALNFMVQQRTRELIEAKRQSDQANVAKTQFLANMSHEIRTPLNAVIGFAQLSKQTEEPEVIRSYVTKIEQSSLTLLHIVNDILDISKIESGKLTLEHTLFDMVQLLQRITVMFENHIQNRPIEWRVGNLLPTNLWYIGDPLRIEQILINLCGNAFKFTQQGEVSLTAKLISQTPEQAQLQLTVSDSGIGIDKQNQKKLFTTFTQADSSTSRRFGGTGLGLAISQELSQLMEGSITIKSEPRKGSQFTVTIWLGISKQPPVTEKQTGRVNLSGLRVLVAEDNQINQLVIQGILEQLGITTTIVADGAAAVAIVQQQLFDLVLMDVQMPILDGYAATREIRKLPNLEKLPIIALTANVTAQDKLAALDAGCNAHIAKPIDIQQLTKTLQQFSNRDQRSDFFKPL